MDILLLVEGLAQAGDGEAGRFRRVDDHLFAPRDQRDRRRDLLDRFGRHDNSAMTIGVDDVVRLLGGLEDRVARL
jgi:hypothetical protein